MIDKFEKDLNLKTCPFYIMGILNVTPDSFSDGGNYMDVNKAVDKGLELISQGADIIDIGGESTRPGAKQVNVEDELGRVVPVINGILKENKDIVISVDTTKSLVADAAINAGARIINDISGFSFDPEIVDVVAKYDAWYVLMHIKGNPENMQVNPQYKNTTNEIIEYFNDKIKYCKTREVDKIIIDPGIGFGKRVVDNYEILANTGEFIKLGYPLLIGLSRKSFLGKSLNIEVHERDNATVIAEYEVVKRNCNIIRTHNVKNISEARKILGFIDNPELTINV